MVYNAVSQDVAAVQSPCRGPTHPSESIPSSHPSKQARVLWKLTPDANENKSGKMDSEQRPLEDILKIRLPEDWNQLFYSKTYFLITNSLCVILIVYSRVSEVLIRNLWLHGWRPAGLCVHVCLVCILANAKYWGPESTFHYQSEDIWAGPAGIPKRSDYLRDVFTPTEM